MDTAIATYVRTRTKDGIEYDSIELYTTPEQIIRKNQPYEQHHTIVEIREATHSDKVSCQYCGLRVTVKSALVKPYWTNGRQTYGIFCSNACHSFRQMGAEG